MKIQLLENIKHSLKLWMVLVAMFMVTAITAVAQEPNEKSVSAGEKTRVEGVIAARDGESFKVITKDGQDIYTVNITPDTSIKSNTMGVFRGGKQYEASYLLRGLQVQLEGHGNSNGGIDANMIRFNEVDLRAAQSLRVVSAPLEKQTRVNADAIAANKERIAAGEENAKRMSGQIDENAANTAKAQGTADAALAEADRANDRINGLGEYDLIKTIVVTFATGSSTLGPKGQAIIDEAAAWVKTQDRRGWMVAVVGFADSTGNVAKNKTLSEKRSNAVIGYLVSKHALPLTRLVQPFGAGVDDPLASNSTAAGRAQNRRVEIRLLKNKGIAGN